MAMSELELELETLHELEGEAGFGESGFGESGFGESGFGESGFGESGFGESGFGESGFAEGEAEQFFGALAGLARKAIASPALRKIGLQAARSALGGLGPVGGVLGGLLPQREQELELEFEHELEGEFEANPLRRAYPDAEALMEHLGHAAAEAETEQEAEAFIGALIPLAAQLIPKVAPMVMKAAPQLVKAASNVAGRLFRSPSVRPLVRAVPNILRRTVADVSRQVAAGRPVTAQGVVRTFARNTANTLGNPRRCVHAYRRSRALDRRFHQVATRPGMIPRMAMVGRQQAPCPC